MHKDSPTGCFIVVCFASVVTIHQQGGEEGTGGRVSSEWTTATRPGPASLDECEIRRPLPPAPLKCDVSSHAGSQGWSPRAPSIRAVCCGRVWFLPDRVVIPEVGTIIILTTSGCWRIKPDAICTGPNLLPIFRRRLGKWSVQSRSVLLGAERERRAHASSACSLSGMLEKTTSHPLALPLS